MKTITLITLLAASQAFAAINIAPDPTSDLANGSLIYTGIDRAGNNFALDVTVTYWDNSLGSFTNPSLSAQLGPGAFYGATAGVAIDPGDYISFDIDILDGVGGGPLSFSPWDSNNPSFSEGTDTSAIASTAFRITTPTSNTLNDDIALIFNPNGSTFTNSAGVDDVNNQTTSDDFFSFNTTTIGSVTFGTGLTHIDDLTGSDTNTFDFISPDATNNQRGSVFDRTNDDPNSNGDTSSTSGYTWTLANIGTESVEAGTVFAFTIDGAASIPEPNALVMLPLGALIFAGYRRRK